VTAVKRFLKSAQTARVLRLLVFTLGSAAVAVPLVQQAELRYPLLGVLVGAAEAAYRKVRPVVVPAPVAKPLAAVVYPVTTVVTTPESPAGAGPAAQ
jgi:hypothetical protein